MTCRCPMCGTKRSGKINKGKRLYTSHNLGTDEHGFQNSKHKRVFRKVLRKRLASDARRLVLEASE